MKDAVILVVDDDPKIRTLLRRCFEGEGSKVREAGDKAATLEALATEHIDLVTLDLDLGADDGFDVAQKIRANSSVPIIMLTGKNDVIDRVVGLEVGADDYVSKPFHLREIIARVKSVLRRSRVSEQPKIPAYDSACWVFDDMIAIPQEMTLLNRDKEVVELTSGEFALLEAFLRRPKRVLSREQLMDLTGGQSYAPLDRRVDNQIARLRKKIERNPASPRLVSTIRGIGYSFTCDVRSCEDHPPSNSAGTSVANLD